MAPSSPGDAVTRPFSVVIDCADPELLGSFWAQAVGYSIVDRAADQYVVLAWERIRERPLVLLQRVPEAKSGKNRLHIDVYASDIEAEATRLEGIGATRSGPRIEEHGAAWIVLQDPEGNEFCVVRDGAGG